MPIVRDATFDCTGTSSATFPGGRTATAGDLLIACAKSDGVNSGVTMSGFTKQVGVDLSTVYCGIIFYKYAAGGETGCALTGSSFPQLQLFRYTGALAAGADQSASNTSGGAQPQTLATGTTGTTAQADELIITLAALSGAVTIGANPWANGVLLGDQSANALFTGERTVSSVATYADTATWTNPVFAALAIATFEAAPVTAHSGWRVS